MVLLKGCKPRLLERITEGERRKGNGREEIVVWREEMGNETCEMEHEQQATTKRTGRREDGSE